MEIEQPAGARLPVKPYLCRTNQSSFTMSHPSLLLSILSDKCPRCRKGNLFKNKNPYRLKKLFAMHDHCPVCGQKTELEIGFWFGTGYVSYGLCIMFSMITFALYWILIGISWRDNSIIHWLILNTILLVAAMPYLIRLSRTIYLSLFVRYDPETENLPAHAPAKENPA